tara:strand:+ start:42 stop:239 length:198 start_codon:yes stop_codon:yes gene_type:complete
MIIKKQKQIKFMDILYYIFIVTIIYYFTKMLDYYDRYKNRDLVETYMLLERIEYLEDEIKILKNK